jgi:hypothetical protein
MTCSILNVRQKRHPEFNRNPEDRNTARPMESFMRHHFQVG